MANEIKDLINAQHDFNTLWVTDAIILAIDEIELLTGSSYTEGNNQELDKIASRIGTNYLINRQNKITTTPCTSPQGKSMLFGWDRGCGLRGVWTKPREGVPSCMVYLLHP